MATSLLNDAFAHHIWATEQLIDACAVVTPAQLQTPVMGTYGSIIETLRHIVQSDAWHLSFFHGRQNALTEEDVEKMSLSELRSAITINGAAWTELLTTEIDPDAVIAERGQGWELHSPMGIRLAQVVHHGTDHRSQVCTCLTSLGLTPPEIDVWAYGRASGREREVAAPAS
jgi:uncharacterized damage-inducible protein DinB